MYIIDIIILHQWVIAYVCWKIAKNGTHFTVLGIFRITFLKTKILGQI